MAATIKIAVTARFDPDGQVTPLSFTSPEGTFPIESVGRHWHDDAGLHILVMAPIDRIFELIFHPTETRWSLGKQHSGPAVA